MNDERLGSCPKCPPAEAVLWPSIIADRAEFQYCMVHKLRWRIGPISFPLPAGAGDGAEFLHAFKEIEVAP